MQRQFIVPLNQLSTPVPDARVIENHWWPLKEGNAVGYYGGKHRIPVCNSDKSVAILLAERHGCEFPLLLIEKVYWKAT